MTCKSKSFQKFLETIHGSEENLNARILIAYALRVNVLDSLPSLQYRTIAFTSASEMKKFEKDLKAKKTHLFNT